jgi:PAS domain-containing protein
MPAGTELLRESVRAWDRDLANFASDAAFTVDEDSRIVGWNAAAHDL